MELPSEGASAIIITHVFHALPQNLHLPTLEYGLPRRASCCTRFFTTRIQSPPSPCSRNRIRLHVLVLTVFAVPPYPAPGAAGPATRPGLPTRPNLVTVPRLRPKFFPPVPVPSQTDPSDYHLLFRNVVPAKAPPWSLYNDIRVNGGLGMFSRFLLYLFVSLSEGHDSRDESTVVISTTQQECVLYEGSVTRYHAGHTTDSEGDPLYSRYQESAMKELQ
ncbi:hypothetical protein EDB84DRAFT_1442288 [Lactarius hengduanensis]|nr:hypothetical protein EDB84DRAFT_1442288 [Lactarius hengduanensis]